MRNLTNLIFTQEPWDRSELAKLPLNPKALLINCQATLFTEIHTNRSLCPASWQQLMVMLITNRFEMTQLISACGKAATRIAHVRWINCVALTERHCFLHYSFSVYDASQIYRTGKNLRKCVSSQYFSGCMPSSEGETAQRCGVYGCCNLMTALTR